MKKITFITATILAITNAYAEKVFDWTNEIGKIEYVGTAQESTLNAKKCIQFSNGYLDATNYVEMSLENGDFLAGDIVIIDYCYKNSQNKSAIISVFDVQNTELAISPEGANAYSYDNVSTFYYRLQQDMPKIRVARGTGGLTTTYVTRLEVTRGESVEIGGTCGNNLTWNLNISTQTLSIEGIGAMYNWYSSENIPWYYYKNQIAHVNLPNGLTNIGNYAFSECTGLTSIDIPNSVTTIGQEAFLNCNKLLSIKILSAVKQISKYAFKGCSKLKTITWEDADSQIIGEGVFANCPSLLSIVSYCEYPPSVDATVFDGCGEMSMVDCYVPNESVVLYKKHNVWKAFNIKALSEKPDTPGSMFNITYLDAENNLLFKETVTLHFPVAPTIEGFTFVGWQPVAAIIESNTIEIQAVYEANEPTSAPEVVTNPSNPAQKLIRNGDVYILTGDHTYTLTGQKVK